MYISPMNLLAGFLALVAVLFVVISIAVAYTPILDLIPGYPGNKSREMLVTNIMKLDSLSQEIDNMQLYSQNIALIMAGRNPVTRSDMQAAADSVSKARGQVGKIPEDSILRSEMEKTGGRYGLSDPGTARKNLRTELELFVPAKGIVNNGFNPQEGHYGVTVATGVNRQVMAVLDGTVVSSGWIPSQGYVLYIQHPDNMISVYRNTTGVTKKVGDRVRGGEVIASVGQSSPDALSLTDSPFEFELWHNGTPVDPQGYIVF